MKGPVALQKAQLQGTCVGAACLLTSCLLVAAACAPIGPRDHDDDALALIGGSESGRGDRSTGLFYYCPDVEPLEIGARLPSYELSGIDGTPLRLENLRGKTIVVTFFETRSPDVALCPTLLQRLGELRRTLRPDLQAEVELVAITVDPDHDTPAIIRDWAQQASVDESLRLTHASPETTARLAANLGLVLWRRDDGSIGHSLGTTVIDRRGRLADSFPGVTGWSTMDLLAAVGAVAGR